MFWTTANIDNRSLLSEIVNSLASAYNWKDFYTPKIKKVVAVNNEILRSYVGNYKLYRNTFNIRKRRSLPMHCFKRNCVSKVVLLQLAAVFRLLALPFTCFVPTRSICNVSVNNGNVYKVGVGSVLVSVSVARFRMSFKDGI